MKKVVLIHCGFHKTGSTSFQHLLKINESKINYYIPKTFRLKFHPINHAPLAWYLTGDERYNGPINQLTLFKKEIKNKNKILLSSEDFALVLSNYILKKSFEKIFSDYKIIYLCFFRTDETRDLSILNEFRYHYKSFKKLKIFLDLFNFKNKGFTQHTIYKSLKKTFYYTSHKKLLRNILKKTDGNYFILSFDKNENIVNLLKKIDLFKNFAYDKKYLNSKNKKKFYNFLKLIIKSKKLFIRPKRNLDKISKLNKLLKTYEIHSL